jgi:hypothetical protein
MTDSLVPNPIIISPGGEIIVQGIQIPAGTSGTPPVTDRIQWISQADGSVVAELYGFTTGSGATLNNALSVKSEAATGQAESTLEAIAGTEEADITVQAVNATAAQVIAHAGAKTYFIGDTSGVSSFPQLRTAQARVVSSGTIDPTGAIIDGTGDFTVTHPGTGNWTITWAAAFPSLNGPNIVVCSYDVRGLFWRAIPTSDTTANIEAINSVPTGVDSGFSFIAIG